MEVHDPIYTFEIARRSVGRAAFYLGIDSMSEGALDVLADILLSYLNRVGRTLSHLVESSGRTSSHVNILDALNACELVAPPAVERLHIRDTSTEDALFATAASSSNSRKKLSSDWKGLATFLFGPKWLEEKEEDDEAEDSARQPGNGAAGGKVGPSATDDPTKSTTKTLGWDAPYLDEVLPYPQASESCANPHPLPPYVGLSLHRAVNENDDKDDDNTDEEEIDQIPDRVFASSWGKITKRKADVMDDGKAASTHDTMEDADDDNSAPPKKKVKIDDGTAEKPANDEEGTNEEERRDDGKEKVYIPPFYPAPPVMKAAASQEGRKVVDIPPAPRIEREEEGSRSVRSSLVQLGSYWGSGWDNQTKNAETNVLAVRLGRNETEPPATTPLVVPVRSASGSRVSRILEGSLDASAMQ